MRKSKSETSVLENEKVAFAFPKIASLMIIAAVWTFIELLSRASTLQPHGQHEAILTQRYYQTAAGWVMVGAFVLSSLLIAYFHGKYSIFWAKAVESKLDERERALRNRIFLRSYRWFLAIMFLFGGLGLFTSEITLVREKAYWVILLTGYVLPSVVASFHKNAR